MSRLRLVEEFVDHSRGLTSLRELDTLLHDAIRDMGFDYYALVEHVDLRQEKFDDAIWLENYPEQWAEMFIMSGLAEYDPIMRASQRTSTGFEWAHVSRLICLSDVQRDILTAARREGVGDGFTVPAHIPGERYGTCNFAVRTGRDLPHTSLLPAQLVGTFAFEAARRLTQRTEPAASRKNQPRLTRRMVDCLELVALGKTDWEIARILGIKEGTVRDYIDEAGRRYGLRRRIQIVLRAIHEGAISLQMAVAR